MLGFMALPVIVSGLMRVAVAVLMPMPMVLLLCMNVPVVVVGMVVVVVGGLAIGLERRHHGRRRKPVHGDEFLGRRRPQHPHPIGEDLNRYMAVAEREQQAGDGGEIFRPQFQHRFRLGYDFGKPAIVEHQKVVGAQPRRRRKVEFDAGSLAAEREAMLAAPVIEPEQQRVGDFAARFPASENAMRTRHLDPQKCQRRAGRSPPGSKRTTAAGRSEDGMTGWAGPSATLASPCTAASRRTWRR
jgi:hypothetical protein